MKNETARITVVPYLAGTVNHVMKNETAKITDSVYLARGTVMERKERLRRKREHYHVRRNKKTAEERGLRLEARRACERHQQAMMSTEQWQMFLQQRRRARNCSESLAECQPHYNEILSPDDPFVISKMPKFYNHLNRLSMMNCSICPE